MGLSATLKFILNHPLNRRDRVGALRRYVAWQIGSRLAPGPIAVPFVDETRLLVSTAMTGATANVYCGLADLEEMGILLHLLRSGDLFIDVGANIGSYSVLAAAAGADVLAIEPVPSSAERLIDNVRLNAMQDRVEVLAVAAGAESGRVRVTDTEDTTNRVIGGSAAGSSVEVEVVRLTDIASDRVVRAIKIDTEGWETPVIDGAEEILANGEVGVLIIEMNGAGAAYGFDESILDFRIREFGFHPVRYDPLARRLREAAEPTPRGNMIYVADPKEAQASLDSAPFRCLGNGVLI